MKTLTILRHAKSGWDDPVARDFDRGLNARGERAAVLVGEAAHKDGLVIDAIISSPAVRCTETLDRFQPAAAMPDMEPHWDRRVYLASSATLLDVVKDAVADYGHILLCGHNPGLEDLILELVADDRRSPLRDVVEQKLPTAALATLECEVDTWQELRPGCARLTRLILPRELDAALGPED